MKYGSFITVSLFQSFSSEIVAFENTNPTADMGVLIDK